VRRDRQGAFETGTGVTSHDPQQPTNVDTPPQHPWVGERDRRRPHPAPRARILLMILIVIGVLGAFGLLIWLALQVNTLTDRTRIPSAEELTRAVKLFRILAIIMSASVLGAAIWIGHFAWRVQQADVYPPPGSRHLRVKRVLRGPEARRVAVLCFTIAGILAVAGASLAPLVFRLLAKLGLE